MASVNHFQPAQANASKSPAKCSFPKLFSTLLLFLFCTCSKYPTLDCITRQINFLKEPEWKFFLFFFLFLSSVYFTKPDCNGFYIRRKGGGGARNLHITQIPPKIGHVECCWSPPQGGPCSVHLPLANFWWEPSEWTSGGCTAALSACFSTVAVNLNILLPPSSGAASPLTRFRPPSVTQWSLPPSHLPVEGLNPVWLDKINFFLAEKKWHVKNSKCWKHALGVATSRWGSGRFTARMAAKGAGYCQRQSAAYVAGRK